MQLYFRAFAGSTFTEQRILDRRCALSTCMTTAFYAGDLRWWVWEAGV